MTTPLAEDEKWVYVCNADEDEGLMCHVYDPNAWIEQHCKRCPFGVRKRVKKNDPTYDFDKMRMY